jgi:hypothetical protein
MGKVAVLAIVVACYCGLLSAAKPMEALNRYNVVLVHGAAPENQGYGDKCNSNIQSAWNTSNDYTAYQNDTANNEKVSWNLGDAVGMLGDYENDEGVKLTYWLDSVVFEDTVRYGSEYIYIQRSFANPAESPAHNAHEIGDRTWKGNNNCSVRRSLFEEAQEVRAGGQDSLRDRRLDSVTYSYRTIPSRNILIAHSMGGVASHEYVTDTNVYNGDVDKMITLDSPHEGTGSLNLLIDMRDNKKRFSEAAWQYMEFLSFGLGLASISVEPHTATIALAALIPSFGLSAINSVVTAYVDDKYLKDKFAFKKEDPLAHYIQQDSAGINALIDRAAHDNMPMVRLLGGYGGITFSDPNRGFRRYLNIFIPDALTMPLLNFYEHAFESDGSDHARFVNAMTGMAIGFAGGISIQDVGSTLVPEYSSLATSTKAFSDGVADVRRWTFNASPSAEDVAIEPKIARGMATEAAVVGGVMAANFIPYPFVAMAAKAAAVGAGAAVYVADLKDIVETGVNDLQNSHENAKARRMLDTLYSAEFSYPKVLRGKESGNVRLMEDFLYERPFVNLSLFVSDSALRAVEPGCYYEADSASKQQLCEVGLYDSLGNVVATTNGKMDYADFRKSPLLKFKSESDWSRVGLKLDRWERVDGLKPGGGDNPKGVPIRHVERYSVPDITVDNFIEKYSFVVDDLMPHRLRQIRLNFNYQEEIAWECDVTKDPSAGDACTVYKRSGGSGWDTLQLEKHPVQKDGRFDFEPRKYGYSVLLALQKDNQNTVTISTVNKIGLS